MPTAPSRIPSTATVACFDLVDTLHFLWSVAQARAVQEQTKMVWVPYHDSAVLKAIYSVFRNYGEPGTIEVTQSTARITELTDKYCDELTDKFLSKAADDAHPFSLGRWMELQRDIRDGALESVGEMFRDAAAINTEIIDGTKQGIKRLAKIHLYSTLALTGMSCAIGIGWVGGLSRAELLVARGTQVSYGIAGDVIKHWRDHSLANAVAVGAAKEGTKELLDHGAQLATEKGVQASTTWALKYLPKLKAANAQVLRYSEQVGRKLASRKANIAMRRLSAAEVKSAAVHAGARNAIRTVKVAKLMHKSVPLVFAAYDVYEAFRDYDEETR